MGWHIAGGVIAVLGVLMLIGVVQQEILPMWRAVLRDRNRLDVKELVKEILGTQVATLFIVGVMLGIPAVGLVLLIGGEP